MKQQDVSRANSWNVMYIKLIFDNGQYQSQLRCNWHWCLSVLEACGYDSVCLILLVYSCIKILSCINWEHQMSIFHYFQMLIIRWSKIMMTNKSGSNIQVASNPWYFPYSKKYSQTLSEVKIVIGKQMYALHSLY